MRVISTPEEFVALQKECIIATHRFTEACNKKFGLNMPPFTVKFNLRSGTAGRAQIGRNIIEYNPTLLRENPDNFLARTVGHEVVHHAAYALHGWDIAGHGPEWRRMMVMMNLPAVRCHSYDISNVPSRIGKTRNIQRPSVLQADGSRVYPIAGGRITDFN